MNEYIKKINIILKYFTVVLQIAYHFVCPTFYTRTRFAKEAFHAHLCSLKIHIKKVFDSRCYLGPFRIIMYAL